MSLVENLCGEGQVPVGTSRSRLFSYPEQTVALPVELRSVGSHYISDPEYSWDGMRRGVANSALLQYTVSGRGALEFDGRSFAVPPGHAMLLTFPEAHRYFLPPDSPHWEVLFVNWGGAEAARILRELRTCFGPVVKLPCASEPLRALRALLDGQAVASAWEAAAAGFSLLMSTARELELHDDKRPRPRFIDPILDFCRANLDTALSVETLAARTGYSRWYFSREFHRVLGVSVQKYVSELRMKYAMELLQNTALSVKEIGARCGFEDTSYFIKVFFRRFRATPGSFRR